MNTCDPDADRHHSHLAATVLDRELAYRLPDTVRYGHGIPERGVRKDQAEFLAAIPGGRAGLAPRGLAHHPRDTPKTVIACSVAVGVVERLEPFDVEHKQS